MEAGVGVSLSAGLLTASSEQRIRKSSPQENAFAPREKQKPCVARRLTGKLQESFERFRSSTSQV